MKKYRFKLEAEEWTEEEICNAVGADYEAFKDSGLTIWHTDIGGYFVREILMDSLEKEEVL